MKKTILLYGLLMAVLIWLLKYLDYRFLVRDLSIEIYLGIIAAICTALGIWMGLRLTRPKVITAPTPTAEFQLNEQELTDLGISKREYEVLELMAEGLSNQEIADRLFISLNTVKTHSSRLFSKLEVKRRTQAVQRAKEVGILP